MSSESANWELPITIHRRPSTRGLGPITDSDMFKLFDAMVVLAYEKGYTIAGVPRPTQTNCPKCGRLVRSAELKRCPLCGAGL